MSLREVSDEVWEEQFFLDFWRWVKVHHPEVRRQFLQDFMMEGAE